MDFSVPPWLIHVAVVTAASFGNKNDPVDKSDI